jgi:phosphoribosylglycinamide formyltransferase-1
MAEPFKIGILASGGGTNAQALFDACAHGALPNVVVSLLGCNRADAGVLDRARRAGVAVCLVDRAQVRSRAERQRMLQAALQEAVVDLVVLAGFDEILTAPFVAAFADRMVNTHPSLLPAFGGTMHAVQQALDYGVKVTGCTLHLVTDDLDAGPILYQRCVPVHDDDTAETLHNRIREEEHRLLPEAVRAFAEGRVRIEGGSARVIASAP